MAKNMKVAETWVELVSREGDEKFRVLADVTSLAVFVYQDGKLKYVNRAAIELTGYQYEDLISMDPLQLFPDEMKELILDWPPGSEDGSGNPVSRTREVAICTHDGEERWIVLNTVPINDYHGKIAWMGTAFDITDRKRSEQLQDAVYRIARAADHTKNLDDLIPVVHAIVCEVMDASNFYIALIDQEPDRLYFPYYVDEYDSPEKIQPMEKGLTEYVLRTGKSLLCDAGTQAELERAGEVTLVGTPSPIWLGVPLAIGDEVIGVMVVQDYHNPLTYGEREQRVLEFVSSQVAMTINRRRTEDALLENDARVRRRADELAALYETARDISGQHTIFSLLQTIVDRATSLLGSSAGSIFLVDLDRGQLEMVVSHGLSEHIGLRIGYDQGVSGDVARTLSPIIENNYQNSSRRLDELAQLQIAAVIAVPMLHSGELVGVLTLYEFRNSDDGSGRHFTQAEMELLTLFSGSAASAVHNTRLLDQTRQRLVELELLYQASLSAAQIHSLRAVAQRVLDTLERMLNWNASLWIIEDQHLILLAHSASGLMPSEHRERLERLRQLIDSFDDGIIGWVCKNGRVVRSGSVKQNQNYLTIDADVQSELCVPLKVGGRTIGCINVESKNLDAFSEHDERLLTTLANQAAISIENARLFEETRQRAGRQAALNAIITASARAGASLDEILNVTLDQTLKAFGLEMGAIWLSWTPYSVQQITMRGLPQTFEATMPYAILSKGDSFFGATAVDDWRTSGHSSVDYFLAAGIVSTIAVPLLATEKRLGGLTVASHEIRRWSQEEIALIEAIGREVGLAAERARLFEQTNRRLNELEAVNKVSTSLRLAKSLQEILNPLVDESLKIMQADAGSVWLYNFQRMKMCQVIGRGWCAAVAEVEFGLGEDLPGGIWKTGDVYFSDDLAQDLRSSPALRENVPAGRGAIYVPIRSEMETIGVLMVTALQPREFTGEDARLLVTLTEIAGNAIHRMRLTEQLVAHTAELEARVDERTTELQSALRKAQAADRLKSEFIANVNHELRTPLTNLVLYYQMLRSQPTVKTEERLNVIGRELQRLRNLIEDLLNLSRFDLGQVPFRPFRQNLNALIQPLVSDRAPLAEDHGLTLLTDLQLDLELVAIDEAMISKAVSNLLTNALNYTPAGGTVLIRTFTEQKDGEGGVTFSVQDTGPGIDADDLPHLFERFYRGKTGHLSGAPGTGLGLAIVKQVVEHHRGQIEVYNRTDGPGSIFSIWLPVKQKQETA